MVFSSYFRLSLLFSWLIISPAMAASAGGSGSHEGESVSPAFAYALPSMPGKALRGLVVTYAPGARSPSHAHGRAVVIAYVLSGAIRSQLEGGASRVYRAGQSWSEPPGAHHLVSENASGTEPARLLALFVVDANDQDLVTYDKVDRSAPAK